MSAGPPGAGDRNGGAPSADEPLRDFISALHSKLLIEELERQRGARR